MSQLVRMPEVLANTSEAAIQTWLVEAGQEIAVGAPLAEVETEKAVVEYAAEVGGTVLELLVPEGQSVAVGDPIAVIGEPGEKVDSAAEPDPVVAAPQTVPEQAVSPEPETSTELAPSPAAGLPSTLPSDEGERDASDQQQTGDESGAPEQGRADGPRRFASPIVRRLARERGIDLATIKGSGPDGRIVRRDLDRAAAAPAAQAPEQMARVGSEPKSAAATPAAPAPAAESGSAYQDVPHNRMRRAIARRLTESKSTVPHFYVVADVRMDPLLALRQQVNEQAPTKVSVNDFLIKGAAAAFLQVPEANAIWTEDAVRRFSGVDVAIAVAVPNGLVTPVLRGVERQSLGAISATTKDLAERARAGRLQQQELEGGAFSISNLGMYGVKEFSAIINPPQSGILAVGAASPRAVVRDGSVGVEFVMTVTLSADHRVIDGALAAQWLAAFVDGVEHPLRLLL